MYAWLHVGLLVVVLAVWSVLGAATSAQHRLQTLAEIRADADGDTVIDAVGDTVHVQGSVQVGAGVLQGAPRIALIHDGTAGVEVSGVPAGADLDVRDQVAIKGVVRQSRGYASIEVLDWRQIGQEGVFYPPVRVDLERESMEDYEGQLVELRGSVVGMGDVPNGAHFTLSTVQGTMVVFVYRTGQTGITLHDLALGTHVTVTGIVGQYDREVPFDTAYQLYPRSPDDIDASLLPPRFALIMALGILATALLAGLWIFMLRRSIRIRMAELHASETRYARLFDHVTVPLALHEVIDGKPTLVRLNKAAEQIFGLEMEDLRQHTWFDLVGMSSRRRAAVHFHQVERRQEAETELEMLIADESVHIFNMRSVAFSEGGRTLILSVCDDITERRAYEEGLIDARQEAERLAQLKSQFLANMSHEIRTPLTGIIGFAEIMTYELEGDEREFATIIQTSGERLLDTLNSVLDLSKLDSGQFRTQTRTFDVVPVVASTIETLQALAVKKSIRLEYTARQPEIEVVSDRSMVARLLTNLVGNALKFTHQGHVVVTVEAQDETVLLQVADTGIGISEEFLPHLFDEFAQESDGMSRDYEGSGLGLAISKRIVDLLGGEIAVESQLGHGTAFIVRIPRRLDAAQAAAEAQASVPR